MWKWFLFKDAEVGFIYITCFTIVILVLIELMPSFDIKSVRESENLTCRTGAALFFLNLIALIFSWPQLVYGNCLNKWRLLDLTHHPRLQSVRIVGANNLMKRSFVHPAVFLFRELTRRKTTFACG